MWTSLSWRQRSSSAREALPLCFMCDSWSGCLPLWYCQDWRAAATQVDAPSAVRSLSSKTGAGTRVRSAHRSWGSVCALSDANLQCN